MAKRQRTTERLLEQHQAEVLAMHRAGRSVYFIADYYRVKPQDVRRFFAARGIALRGKPYAGRKGDRGENVHEPVPPRPRDSITSEDVHRLMLRWPRVA